MSQSNSTIPILGSMFILAAIAFMLNGKQKENFEDVSVTQGVTAYPTYPGVLDPRLNPATSSGIVRNAVIDPKLQAAPADSANYNVKDMINMGGCAALRFFPPYPEGGQASNDDKEVRQAFRRATAASESDMAAVNKQFGRYNTYDASVAAENMLPDTEITCAVDPTKDFIYQRSLNTQMRRRPRGQQDLFRGDIKPINAYGSETWCVSFGTGQASQGPTGANFVSRYGNSTETLSKGYFSAFNDIEQSMQRDEALFQTRAQSSRDMALVQTVQQQDAFGDFVNSKTIQNIFGS